MLGGLSRGSQAVILCTGPGQLRPKATYLAAEWSGLGRSSSSKSRSCVDVVAREAAGGRTRSLGRSGAGRWKGASSGQQNVAWRGTGSALLGVSAAVQPLRRGRSEAWMITASPLVSSNFALRLSQLTPREQRPPITKLNMRSQFMWIALLDLPQVSFLLDRYGTRQTLRRAWPVAATRLS